MQGLMQDKPLSIIHLFDRAEKYHSDKTITTATATGLERTTYGDWARADPPARRSARHLGISADGRVATFAWNTARHLELYFAAPCTRPGAAHAEHPAVPRAAHVHRQPRRGRGDLRRPLAARPAAAAAEDVRDGQAPRADGRRQGRHPRRPERPRAAATTRTCWPPPTPVEFDVVDENTGRQHVLHERHDRQPEGRRLQPSQHVPAHDGRA